MIDATTLPQHDETMSTGPSAVADTSVTYRLAGIIPSKALLAGQPCVAIEHEGACYVLRATRAGKLILTK